MKTVYKIHLPKSALCICNIIARMQGVVPVHEDKKCLNTNDDPVNFTKAYSV